jgi:hypothetical protein
MNNYREAVALQSPGSPALRRTLDNEPTKPGYAEGVTQGVGNV